MIRSFRDKQSEAVHRGEFVARFQAIQKVALRKLDMINAARELQDLVAPPNNRLEALKGDRAGQHSIRINDQYRICFEWREDGPHNVEIIDYH
ncbi:type II toxin-antitoxin system RelE/ParE family toxin [Iodidimonas sp. SYSU 1G8]|uniref:type II toxin-antitoxin system RelE/ParE family toxin n=1 Tax=Iodidimonas sp. SYSU 1G8 TaxID=3133967 RepID=UPI0031FED893